MAAGYPGLYDYVSVPAQTAGQYRVGLTPTARAVGWYDPGGDRSCRAAYAPVTRTASGPLGGRMIAFAAWRAFSDVVVRTPGRVVGDVTLSRRMGNRWIPVVATWAAGGTGGVLGFADQPAGSYRLRFGTAQSGTYGLLSGRYTIVVTDGAISKAATVAAGGTTRLNVITDALTARSAPASPRSPRPAAYTAYPRCSGGMF